MEYIIKLRVVSGVGQGIILISTLP